MHALLIIGEDKVGMSHFLYEELQPVLPLTPPPLPYIQLQKQSFIGTLHFISGYY